MKLSIVIPCYNERSTIEAIVDAIRAGPVKDIEVIIVDDSSTDGTRELLSNKPSGWVDAIIQPHETRDVLVRLLKYVSRPMPKARFHTGVVQT